MDPFLFFIIIFIKWDWVRKQNWTEIFGRFWYLISEKKKKNRVKLLATENY